MGKTLRKFSKKGKKTQHKRKTRGKKYGGNDEDCNIGEKINECELDGKRVNNEHREKLVNCFNSIAKTTFTKDTEDKDLKKAYRKAVVKLHPDKVKDEADRKIAEEETAKLNNAYNGLTECKVQETVMTKMYYDEPEPSSINQTQRLDITNAIMKKIFGNECDKEHPEPTGFFRAKLKPDDIKIRTRNDNLAKCELNNRRKVLNYLKKKEEMKNPILTVNDAKNVQELEFYNILCADGDNDACIKLEEIASTMGGKGKSKKSTRKTKKAKYSKRK